MSFISGVRPSKSKNTDFDIFYLFYLYSNGFLKRITMSRPELSTLSF